MKVAFHFDAEHGGYYGPPINEVAFRAFLVIPREHRHLRMYCGDLITYGRAEAAGGLAALVSRLLDARHWTTLVKDDLVAILQTRRVYVIAVEGLTRAAAAEVHALLGREESYIGALEVTAANPAHWVMYDQSLIPLFRIVGNELRMFYEKDAYEAGADRDDGMFDHWRESRLFETVVWEDTGLRGTIFDEYDTLEHAQRLAELEELLSGQLSAVVNEIVIRARDLDPVLPDALHAALSRFSTYESDEQLAQVAVSCRRFLERLANALYPPRNELVDGRKVGAADYRNRLWAYIHEKRGVNRDIVLATLEDVGKRIDHLDALANKGVHAPSVATSEVQRLLVALIALTYDVMTLEPPPIAARTEPYEEAVRRFLQDLRAEAKDDG